MEADETKNLRISVAPVNGLRFEDKPFGYLFFVGFFFVMFDQTCCHQGISRHTLSSDSVAFVVEMGLSYPTGCNLCVNLCALNTPDLPPTPSSCGFGPFTVKSSDSLPRLCVCCVCA